MAINLYEGTEPFVFVSYAHKDAEIVLEILEALSRVGMRIWYDKSIHNGEYYKEKLAQKITDCDRVLFFVSENSINSKDCRKEINIAVDRDRPINMIRLDDAPFAYGLDYDLTGLHYCLFSGDVDSVVKELLDDPAIEACKGAVSTVYEFWRPSTSYFGLWRSKEDRDAENEMLDSEWGPERPVYHDGEYPEGFAVNSRVDHPEFGDMRRFVAIRKVGTDRWMQEMTLEPNERYEVRLAYRVDGDPEKNRKGGTSIAMKLKASVHVPECVYPFHYGRIRGAIHATWSQPGPLDPNQEIWSSVVVGAKDCPLFLSFIPATARVHNKGKLDDTTLGTQLFGAQGLYLGFNKFSGIIPAGDEYMGAITFEFETRAHQGDCTISRSVATEGSEFVTSMFEAKPGDLLTFKSSFANVTDVDLTNVTFRDVLGKGMELVPGTTKLVWSASNTGGEDQLSDSIAANGINTGFYGPNVTAELTYQVKVPESERPCNYLTTSNVFHDGGSRRSSLLIHASGSSGEDARLVNDPEHDPRFAEWLAGVPRSGGWGPEREMFTMKRPARYAAFNSISDNNILGDERNFVCVRRKAEKKYVSRLQVVPGYLYEVYIWYNNAASPSAGEPGTARDVRLRMSFPTHLDAMAYGEVSATISASNTNPPAVWNGSILWAAEPVVMRYVPGSAKLYNGRHKGLPLDEHIFYGDGILLGADALDGVISCTDNEAYGHVSVYLACEEA